MNLIKAEIKEKAAELNYSEEEAAADFAVELMYTLDEYFRDISPNGRNRRYAFQRALHNKDDWNVMIISRLATLI